MVMDLVRHMRMEGREIVTRKESTRRAGLKIHMTLPVPMKFDGIHAYGYLQYNARSFSTTPAVSLPKIVSLASTTLLAATRRDLTLIKLADL